MQATSTTTYLLGGCLKHRALPIANVEVTLVRAANRFAGTAATPVTTVLTQTSGEYRFAVDPGEYYLHVRPSQGTRFVTFQTDPIFVNSNTRIDIPLELGQVWNGKFRSACANDREFSYQLRLVAEPGGKSVLERPIALDENFELVLEKTGYRATVHRHAADMGASATGVTVWSHNLLARTDIKMDIVLPELFKLTGWVADEQGFSVNRAQVMVIRDEYVRLNTAEIPPIEAVFSTGPDGRYTGVLPAGIYQGVVTAAGLSAVPISIDLHTDANYKVTLPPGLNASGQILWRGVPVTGLSLLIKGVNQTFLLPAKVDTNGKFDVWLAPGTYEFRIAGCEHSWEPPEKEGTDGSTAPDNEGPPERLTKVLAPWTKLIDVNNDINGNIKLQDGAIVEFEVVDPRNRPVVDCQISCFPYDGQQEVTTQPDSDSGTAYGAVALGYTDNTGRCRLIVAAGIYTFCFTPDKLSDLDSREIRQLSINADIRRKVRLSEHTGAVVETEPNPEPSPSTSAQ